jgi:hypothetical protein
MPWRPSPPHPTYRPPGNHAPGTASLSPHRLQRHTPHRRSDQNRPLHHRPSDKITTATAALPPTSPATASPSQAAASSNPHSRQPPTRRPAGSFLGGFRTPALRARMDSYDGPVSETLVWTAPASQGLVAAGDGSGRLRSCVRPWCAAMSTAGPDGLRGSGPKHHGGVYAPKGFPGYSDPRFDRSPSCCCPCKRQVRTR